jgi:hypothetical protein
MFSDGVVAYMRAAALGFLLIAVVMLAACGSPSGQQASAVATPATFSPAPSSSTIPTAGPTSGTPASPPPTLYAVLEAPTQYAQNTTVAIAGLDGYARAKTHFTPRSSPYAPDVAVVLAPEAHVAAGVVYFVDGRGVVRTLAPSGVIRQVAVFPITLAQQEISFAVSPDGTQLMAAILTLPAVGNPIPGTGWRALVGPWKLQVDRADAGGATVVLRTWQSSSEPGCTSATCPGQAPGLTNIMMAGWDAQGPVAVVGSNYATQYGLEGSDFYGGHFANVDMNTGVPGPMLGACQDRNAGPWSVGVDGTTLCVSYNTPSGSPLVSVDSPGQSLWQPAINSSISQPGSFVLSTDGSQLAMDGAVVSRSGSNLALNNSFRPEGWLDAATLIGLQLNENDPNQVVGMAYVRLSDPAHPVNLGFVGEFVGRI